MNKLKRLQKQYVEGKLTKAQYEAAVADLLDDEDVTQDEHDDALDFDPEGSGDDDKPIYTQADVDGIVVKKARALVKKAARDAGIDVSDMKATEIVAKVAELAAAGVGKAGETDQEVKELRKKAASHDALVLQTEVVMLENVVLKAAGKYNPVNPMQVVRALNGDYKDLLTYDDETGLVDPKSVAKAIRRITEVEPNLFHTAGDDGEDEEDLQGEKGGEFSGKPPGGAGAGGSKKAKDAEKQASQKAAALAMMGISTDSTQN